jgi:asparagine synthase (glutamine-hydrolysing)
MAAALRHRGPDDQGTWCDTAESLALGHSRLAVLDLSPTGRQPMVDAAERRALVLNGEIYNHLDLRRELAAKGHAFRGTSDTETLLAAIAEWGLAATLLRSNGMFALALWDRLERRLSLARDRLGQKPLYYTASGRRLLFASQIKALLAHPGFEPRVRRDAIPLLLRRSCLPAPYTILEDVWQLPPGHILEVGLDDLAAGRGLAEPTAWWSVVSVFERGVEDPLQGSENELVDDLEALLLDAVRRTTLSDVPLGCFLSGGVDSSLVAALLTAVSDRPPPTFTIGFGEKRYDESPYAARVARHLGTEHVEHRVEAAEALAVVHEIPEVWDEPFADSSQIPTLLLSRLARRRVTVALSGDGGDELFAGYANYRLLRTLSRLDALPRPLLAPLAAVLSRLPASSASPDGSGLRGRRGERLRRLGRFLAETRGLDDMHLRLLSTWKRPADLVPGSREPVTLLNTPARWPPIRDVVRRAQALDAATYLPDDILVKVDRAAMSVGLETRLPLLDHRVVEWAARLPPAADASRDKHLLRRVLLRHLPVELFARPKMGFSVPLDDWLRGRLRPWCEALLAPDRLRREGFFDSGPITEKWRQHATGSNDWAGYLWPVLMFQAWHERWLANRIRCPAGGSDAARQAASRAERSVESGP